MDLQHRLWLIPLITATTYCLHATTFNVTTTNIFRCGLTTGRNSMRRNATPGDNQIPFSSCRCHHLGLPLPTITNSVAITGGTSTPTVISGGGTLPLFIFAAGTTNSLSNLVLTSMATQRTVEQRSATQAPFP